jgi:sulfatase maturation enzyme AslB (radical SAM superfamily)
MTKNFCNYPFRHLSIGATSEVRACCVAEPFPVKIQEIKDLNEWWANYADYREMRDSFKQDLQHTNCKTCWRQESAGSVSLRNRFAIKEVSTETYGIEEVEFTGGRLCNLACRMCFGFTSSLIEKEKRPWDGSIERDLGPVNWLDDTIEQDKILKLLCTPTLKKIYFTGGEPQLIPSYQTVIGQLAERRDLSKLNVHFNSNCTVFNEYFWDKIRRFNYRQVDMSIDAVDTAYDLIRYNGSWDKTYESVFRIRDYMSKVDHGFTRIYLTIVGQLGNVDQATALQELFDSLSAVTNLNIGYDAILIPVTLTPEWEWQNVPVDILKNELNKLDNLSGTVINLFKKDLENAIVNNCYTKEMTKQVMIKEKYFKNQFGKCLWDRKPEWFEIYSQ